LTISKFMYVIEEDKTYFPMVIPILPNDGDHEDVH
jgi:hypothetical protein